MKFAKKLILFLVLPLLLCGCDQTPVPNTKDYLLSSSRTLSGNEFNNLVYRLSKIEKKIDEHDEFLKSTVKRLEDNIR